MNLVMHTQTHQTYYQNIFSSKKNKENLARVLVLNSGDQINLSSVAYLDTVVILKNTDEQVAKKS